MTALPSIVPLLPPLLAFELLLGALARLSPFPFPALYHSYMARKAVGTRDAFYPVIPIRDPVRHSNFIGVLMFMAGGLVGWKKTRVVGAIGTVVLTWMGIYSQRRMGMAYWLPCLNCVLAIVTIGRELEIV